MEITVKNEMNFNDLMNNCWSGAVDTLQVIEENGKEEELMLLLDEIFLESIPTMTEVNDFLWFDDEMIYESLGIIEEEEEEEEE